MAEAGAIPQATLDMISARATVQYNEWKTTVTEEQKQSGHAMMQRYKTDEAFRTEHQKRMAQTWADADADGDGMLNLAEYRVFDAAMRKYKVDAGEWHESDHAEENWNIANSLNAATDGVTMAELRQIMVPWMAKFEELKAADDGLKYKKPK